MNNPIYSDPEWIYKFLHNAAIYFENRPTNGEDTAYWANTYNAEKCLKIADEVTRFRARITELEAALERLMGPPPDKIKLRTGMMAAGVSEKTADQILSSPTFNRSETIEKPIMSSMSTKPMENINEQQD